MKKVLFIIVLVSFASIIFGQVAINQDGSPPVSGAILHVKGTGGSFFVEDATANIGIGTVTPNTSLHIVSSDPVIRLQDDVSGNDATAKIEFGGTNGGVFESVGSIGDFSGGQFLSINSPNAVNITANDINGIYIKDNGFVGIGTNKYASERLHVRGNVYLESGNETSKLTRDITGNHDLLPIAYGVIQLDGTIVSGTENFTVSHSTTGVYVVTIDGVFYQSEDYFTFVSPRNSIWSATLGSASELDTNGNPAGNLKIRTWKTSDGTPKNTTINFIVYKP